MRSLALWLLPAALFAGQPRYARLGDFAGIVEVQLQAADGWILAERNLPLPELAWIRTGPGARVEIELDDGGVWRLGSDSQGEISDYTRLSTGQRIATLSLDRGVAYYTGKPGLNDSLLLAVPGAQAILTRPARLRLEARGDWSQIAVLEGAARFSSPAAEMDLREGLCARVEPGKREAFYLDRKIPDFELDAWSADRDRLLAGGAAQRYVAQRYGLADLDAGGTWISTEPFGPVWKPKVADDWAPFQAGRWRWYDTLGYTWVGDEPWGWLPYHYGRWAAIDKVGWVWAPSMSPVFKPGEVFWMLGAQLAGWGPLAPGERWTAEEPPVWFAKRCLTFALLPPEARTVDPAGLTLRPAEPLAFAAFTAALPSPSFPAIRLDAPRPLLEAGGMRLRPVLRGVTYGSDPEPPPAEPYPDTPPGAMNYDPADAPSRSGAEREPSPSPGNARGGGRKEAAPSATASKSASSATGKSTAPARDPRERELEIYDAVMRDGNDPARLLADLETWSREFPHSAYADERTALYVQAYASLKPAQPAKALDVGGPLLARNLQTLFPDPQRGPTLVLSVLYSMTLSGLNIQGPTAVQTQAGLAAARQLVTYVPVYFTPSRKPANVTAESWAATRASMETLARQTVALLAPDGRVRDTVPRGRN